MSSRTSPVLNMITSITLCTSLLAQSSIALAGNGAADGNSGDNPAIAYSPSQVDAIRAHLNLDYLKLTPAEITKRDKQLQPIYDYYKQATADKVVEQIKSTFGTNIYVSQRSSTNPDNGNTGVYTPNLSDKDSTMDSAIRFYTGVDLKGSPFEHMDSTVLSGVGSVNSDSSDVEYMVTTDDTSHFSQNESINSYFLLGTYQRKMISGMFRIGYVGVYSSLDAPLFTVPVLDNFLSAIKDSNLKGLDASVAFMAGPVYDGTTTQTCDAENNCNSVKNSKPYVAIYPTFSHLAPIPQPILFVSREATEADLSQMLVDNAQKIYAYNQLFNQQLLPQADEIAASLAKYPDVSAALQKLSASADQANMQNKLYEGFLKVSFGLLAAGLTGVTLDAMLTAPALRVVLIDVVTIR